MPATEPSRIIEANESVKMGKRESIWLQPFEPAPDNNNEMVFFLKPEVSSAPSVDLEEVLNLCQRKFREFSASIAACGVLGARYLETYGIIERHYGVINSISKNGSAVLSQTGRDNLNEAFAQQLSKGALILGGHQFLDKYNFFSAESLSVLWDNLNSSSKKLAPGSYAISLEVLTDKVILLNGFNPYQLLHYTAPNRTIVVMVLRSSISWQRMRDELIGDTDPLKAQSGSIRQELFASKDRLGIKSVNKGLNGVHLSAGPLEGMVEIVRFASDYEQGEQRSYEETSFGHGLSRAGFSLEEIKKLADNPTLIVDARQSTAFDASEGMDKDKAIKLFSANR